MANEQAFSFGPDSGWSEAGGSPTGGSTQPYSLAPVGTVGIAGAGFKAGITGTLLYLVRIPDAAALATGLTFTLVVCDDTQNPPSAGGKHSYWGVTIGPVTSGTSAPDETVLASCTEDFVTITHSSTVGKIVVASLAAVVAHFNSLAAGNLAMVRLRRVGGNAADTHTGRVALLRFEARNT